VEHRHLLPDEFDLLVDGEEGFGVAPLLGHIESCAECRAQLESRRRIAHELERLQHLTPSPLFAYRVMQRVQVYEPWYVAALDSARPFVPRSKPARVFAGATAGFAALTMTVATVWIVSRLDVLFFLLNVGSDRARAGALQASSVMLSSALGEGLLQTLRERGAAGISIALSVFLLTVLIAAFSLRAVTAAARQRRS
jgi:hypothetical protein